MKKLSMVFLTAFMLLFVTACKDNDLTNNNQTTVQSTEDTQGKPEYKDGTYTKRGPDWEFGYETVEVTIAGGEVTNVILRRLQTDGTEVNYDEWTGANNRPNLKQMRIDLANEIIQKQSAEQVDAITGATVTTQNGINAVKQALEDAKKTN
jgi:uncharacterized protein with FMN-binding domain